MAIAVISFLFEKVGIAHQVYSIGKEYLEGKSPPSNILNITTFALKAIREGMFALTVGAIATGYSSLYASTSQARLINRLAFVTLGIALHDLNIYRSALGMLNQYACNKIGENQEVKQDEIKRMGELFVTQTQAALFLKIPDAVANSFKALAKLA